MPKKYNAAQDKKKWDRVNSTINQINKNDRISRQIEVLKGNIAGANIRKIKASLVLCWYYSARAKETFRRFQGFNMFWDNQTFSAYSSVFADVISAESEIGFLIAHQVEYGVYLELANDRKHESLYPIIRELDSEFMADLRRIWV